MEDQIKIYDTVRGNQLLYYNSGYNTTNSTKMKKNSNHWTNIFTWKKKAKQQPNSIINYPFVSNQKYSSMSAATGVAYSFAPPPGRLPPPPSPAVNAYATPDMNYIAATTTTTTTIHASVRHNPAHRQIQNRNSLFYSPWETFHDHSAQHMQNECTCQLPEPSVVDTYCSKNEIQKSLRGLSSKSVPMIASTDEPIYDSRRLSRMDLYSVEEENSPQKTNDFKSKSSDSLLDIKKTTHPPNGLKNSRSSTTLSSNPYALKPRSKDSASATINERFLKFFKKSALDPYNSIASRKSILECDVSAYDLIKQNLELKLFEDDDSLSDNAIENETNCEEIVGNVYKSNSRKSFSVDSQSNESNMNSEPRNSLVANSVRIGGYGMSFAPPAPKHKQTNLNKSPLKNYSNYDSNYETPSTSSWSGSGSSNDKILLPEPDYDIDDAIDNESYSMKQEIIESGTNFHHLKVSYSPPMDLKKVNGINTEDVNKQIDEIYGKSSEREQYCSFENKFINKMNINESDINKALNNQKVRVPSVATDEPPLPPPEPPVLPLAPVANFAISKSGVQSKANSNSNLSVSAYQCELKDKLTSGVKSILKKTRTQSNQLSRDHLLSKSETNLNASTSGTSDSCDYLKTFKQFKESRLRPMGRHRKHVHFKSHSHDRLLINEITAQTIPEVEESDEPIYDDVRLPGVGSNIASDDDSGSCGQQTINDRNDCHKSEQLNAMSESITSDNRIIKSVTNDNSLTNNSPMRTTPKGPVEFAEFDPSEDLSQSSSITTSKAVVTKTNSWQNKVDLKAKHNSLIESHRNFSANHNENNENSSNCNEENANNTVTEDMREPDSSKNAFPSPATNTSTFQAFNIGAEFKDGSNANQLKVPVVQRKYLPVMSTQPPNKTPVAKPRDDRQQGKQINRERTDIKGPVAQARAHKSLAVSSGLTTNKSYLSPKEEKMIEIIGDQKCKRITQTLLPVSQDSKCTQIQNNVQNNKNSLQLSDTNVVRHEKQTQNNCLLNNNTEIEIFDYNQRESLEANEPIIEDNCLPYARYHSSYGTLDASTEERAQNRPNPYLCTISIKNGSNQQIINQTSIETNLGNNVCVSGVSSIPFESIDSSHSSLSLCDSGAQSSMDSLTNDRSLKSLVESPITVLCANSNDKIVINVPSDHTFDNINEHIYEELDTESIYVDTDGSLENIKSIFDGASKDEILEFLEDAKERVGEDILVDTTTIDTNIEILEAIDVIQEIGGNPILSTANRIDASVPSSSRRNRTSNVSNSSTDSTATTTSSSIDIEDDILKCAITNSISVGQLVERNDSGVGAETSKPSRHRKLSLNDEVEHQCADCEMHVDPNEDDETGLLHYPLFCHRCDKKRSERKEIISEIVDTEFKYGRDLRIIREEFYRPIEIAGLLSKEQLKGVFLNLDQLISVNSKFSEKLQDAIDIATEQGDEDFTTVNIGKLFRDSSSMLHAFEVYCVRQGSAALLLNHLEKEKELLRIFLRVSQMENTLLRRMNLRSFLVVPVQRVTKYPLLLNRLYKVTPYHHRDREALRESQQKVELHLEHINQQTKGTIGTTTRIWRRISNLSTSHRRLNNADDIGNIKLRKAALEILKWNQEETQFVIIGKVFFTSITDYTVNRKTKTMKFLTASALLATLGRPNQNYRPDLVHSSDADKNMVFTRDNTGISDAVLLLIKEKCGRYALCKEILNLKSCVISTEMESGDEMFEIHEQTSKESLLLKADSSSETKDWFKQLKYHSKDLGNWRRRRNALANIMMIRQ